MGKKWEKMALRLFAVQHSSDCQLSSDTCSLIHGSAEFLSESFLLQLTVSSKRRLISFEPHLLFSPRLLLFLRRKPFAVFRHLQNDSSELKIKFLCVLLTATLCFIFLCWCFRIWLGSFENV